MLGFDRQGDAGLPVIVLNDWLCDTSTWEPARPFLDPGLSWVFADLRGYGRSRGQAGRFDLAEAAADVLALADGLGLGSFALVGHSMSTLVALHLAQHHPARVARAMVVTPPPPAGTGADDATIARIQAAARGDDAGRAALMGAMWGDRLGEPWLAYKVARWRATSDAEAVAAYVPMFARHGLPDVARRVEVPLLALACERDVPPMRRAAVEAAIGGMGDRVAVAAIEDAGHYPMQEAPPLTAAIASKFLGGLAEG